MNTNNPITFSFISCTYRREPILEKTLDALLAAIGGEKDIEIIVVNDEAGRPLEFSKPYEQVQVVTNLKRGYAAAMNTGARIAKGAYCVFMDNDMIIDDRIIPYLRQFIIDHPTALFNPVWVYPPVLLEEMKKTPFGRALLHDEFVSYKRWNAGPDWQDDKIFSPRTLTSNFMLVKRDVYTELGGFNEAHSYGTIDDEFTLLAAEKGYKLLLDPTLEIWHNEEDRLDIRNRLQRVYAVGANRRARVDEGNMNYALDWSPKRRALLNRTKNQMPFLFRLASKWPNARMLDPIYQRLAAVLISSALMLGYEKSEMKLPS